MCDFFDAKVFVRKYGSDTSFLKRIIEEQPQNLGSKGLAAIIIRGIFNEIVE